MERKTFENGITYVTHGLLGYGDYDDSGAVERANVRYLEEEYPNYKRMSYSEWERGKTWKGEEVLPISELVELYGDFGSSRMWIREDIEEENEYIKSLENYPALDDELVNEIEDEIEKKCWKDWIEKDLIKSLPENWREIAENMDEEELFEVYLKAKEQTNEYFMVEVGGIGYVDVEEIASIFRELLEERIRMNIKTGVTYLNKVNYSFLDEDFIDLEFEQAKKERKEELEEEGKTEEEIGETLEEEFDCRETGTVQLYGEWLKDEEGKYYPDPNGEYSAIYDSNDNYIQVVHSQYFTFTSFCSPCFPDQGNLDSCGNVPTYCLPPELLEEEWKKEHEVKEI